MKTYNFTDFMRGQHEAPKRSFKAYSYIPVPTISTLFFNEPCLILLGVGACIVGTILWEKNLTKNGRDYDAEKISMIVSLGLPMVVLGGFIFFILRVGQTFL